MLRRLVTTAAVAALLVTACSDDDATSTRPEAPETMSPTSAVPVIDAAETTESSSTTEAPATTEAPSTTAATPSTADEPDDAGSGDVQFETLSSRPWAGPDDAHETPEAAVEAFLEFATSAAAGGLFGRDDVAIGGYSEGDARSGEVNVGFVEQSFDTSLNTSVLPAITVMVRRAGPQDTWWVVAAVTDGLTVAAPAADAEIRPVFDVDFTNDRMADQVQQRLFDAGDDEPFFRARVAGGGIFTTGRHAATLDTTSCGFVDMPETDSIDFEVDVCDGPGTAGAEGTFVLISDAGITTVAVVFAE